MKPIPIKKGTLIPPKRGGGTFVQKGDFSYLLLGIHIFSFERRR
jgi:hypothetical protein